MKTGPGQKPIKIDANLWNELDKWMQTENAKKFGYHSKAQFATEAIRAHIMKMNFMGFMNYPKEVLEQMKRHYDQSKEHYNSIGVHSFEEFVRDDANIGLRLTKQVVAKKSIQYAKQKGTSEVSNPRAQVKAKKSKKIPN